MPNSLLSRRRLIAAKVEGSEGTAETLAAADAKILAYDPKVSYDFEMFQRNPARASSSPVGRIVGKRPAGLTFKLELRGSGTAATEPEWSKVLKACGYACSSLYSITVGAITTGPFQHGEVITGGTSNATGRVIINTANGVTTLYFVALSDTFQSGETITGGTSGAAATTGSVPSAVGKVWEPLTFNNGNISSLTMGCYEDGIKKVLRGCRGNVKFSFKSGEPAFMDFDFKGVEAGVTDSAMLSGIAHESTKPPAFVSASLAVDSIAALLSQIDIDTGASLNYRDDVNSDRGILSALITERALSGSFDPEMVLAATYDYHSKWIAGTEAVLDFILGSTTGNKFRFYAPHVQYTKVEDSDRNGIKVAACQFDLNAPIALGDTELAILAL